MQSKQASGLHSTPGMRWIAAILAASVSVGCGVGYEDIEAEAALGLATGRSAYALTAVTGTFPSSTQSSPDAGSGIVAPVLPGLVAAPQDPIPCIPPSAGHGQAPPGFPAGGGPRPANF
jgi:hypothetical protein